MKYSLWIRLCIVGSFVLNIILVGIIVRMRSVDVPKPGEPVVQYPLLANRLFAENKNDIFVNFMPLRQALREHVSKQPEKISLYFEYLPSGSSIGINDTDEIEMASLAKLPTVLAVYDKIHKGELDRNQVLTVTDADIDTRYGTFWQKGVGAKLPLMEAVGMTLDESDNTTHNMLYHLLSVQNKVDIFQKLDIRVDLEGDALASFISAKSYSSILKSLYLSSYVPQAFSSEILTLMSKTVDAEGIDAGVEQGIPVAHKTGTLRRADGLDVYNDCGIVYVPKRPYVLCMLINGEDEKKAHDDMKFLSNMIYKYIIAVNNTSSSPSGGAK